MDALERLCAARAAYHDALVSLRDSRSRYFHADSTRQEAAAYEAAQLTFAAAVDAIAEARVCAYAGGWWVSRPDVFCTVGSAYALDAES